MKRRGEEVGRWEGGWEGLRRVVGHTLTIHAGDTAVVEL